MLTRGTCSGAGKAGQVRQLSVSLTPLFVFDGIPKQILKIVSDRPAFYIR